jgi:tetratricopeptide (TPR) repeat protein
MQLKLTGVMPLRAKRTKNLEAYLKVMEGMYCFQHQSQESFTKAKILFEEAIALDPEYVLPYGMLSYIHIREVWDGMSRNPPKSMEEASKLAKKCLELDQNHPMPHFLLGVFAVGANQHEKALKLIEHAHELAPNDMAISFWLGNCLLFIGKPKEAIPVYQMAVRINPIDPHLPYMGLGWANEYMEKYEEAIAYYKNSLETNPENAGALYGLPRCYAALGREEEARSAAAEVLKLNPRFSIKRFILAMGRLYRDKAFVKRMSENLLKAGLPE